MEAAAAQPIVQAGEPEEKLTATEAPVAEVNENGGGEDDEPLT